MSIQVTKNEGNLAARDINITLTQVDSVPCVDPYCDTIIAEVKADLRGGLCADCYKQGVKNSQFNVVKPYRLQFFFILLLMIVTLFHEIINLVLHFTKQERLLTFLPEFWIWFIWAAILFYKIGRGQSRIEREKDLRK